MISNRKLAIFLIAIAVIYIAFQIYDAYKFYSNPIAKVSNITIGYETNGNIYVTSKIPLKNAHNIVVCGSLDTSVSEYLEILIVKTVDGKTFGINPVDDAIAPGSFCAHIKLLENLSEGEYKILIIDERVTVAQFNFQTVK